MDRSGGAEHRIISQPMLETFPGLAVNVVGSPQSGITSIILEAVRVLSSRCRPAVILNGRHNASHAVQFLHAGASVHHWIDVSGTDTRDVLFIETARPLDSVPTPNPQQSRLVLALGIPELENVFPACNAWLPHADALLVTEFGETAVGSEPLDRLSSEIRRTNPYLPVFAVSARQSASITFWASWLIAQWQRACGGHRPQSRPR